MYVALVLNRLTSSGTRPDGARPPRSHVAEGYACAARVLNAHVDEVAFQDSGNAALASLLLSVGFEPGDRVLVDAFAWAGLVAMLSSMDGVIVEVMPVDDIGDIDLDGLRKALAGL